MKKQIFIILIIILIKLLIPIKPYLECNQLNIITEIKIECKNEYIVTYIETIPIKEDNGIKYQKKEYIEKDKNLKKAINKIEKNKNIYKDKAKIKYINCNKKEDLTT